MTGVRYPKPAILEEVAATRHAVLEASAGTGKTYALEHLVIDVLLRTGATLDQILVVTFTEKAAAELRHRLRRKIAEVANAQTEDPSTGDRPHWVIDANARRTLARALMSFDSAAISTIHSFCQRVLIENAFANLRLFDQRLIDGRAAFSRAFLDVLREHLAKDPEPRSYVGAWLRSRKLEALEALLYTCHTRRGQIRPPFDPPAFQRAVRHLMKVDLRPHNLEPALGRAGVSPATKEAILARIVLLRRQLAQFERSGDVPELLESLASEEAQLGGYLPYLVEELGKHVTHQGRLLAVYEGAKALLESAPTLESAIVQVFLPRVRAYLSHAKRQSGQLDFDDMLEMVCDSVESREGDALARTLRERYRFALIDEFQDTDEIQWRIFSRIFVEGGESSLYVIGDPKQAIYGFRGADVHTYLLAKQHIESIGGRTVHLIENHRSSRPMLAALNLLLDQSAAAPFFTGEIRYDHPVTCGRPTFFGLERNGQILSPVHSFSMIPAEERLSSTSARNTHARRIAKEIALLLDGNTMVRSGEGSFLLEASDIFILTRSGREGVEVSKHLRRARIPYSFYRQDGLFQTSEARDIRSLLLAIRDPHKRDRRFRAWQTPFFDVPLESLLDCRELPGAHPLVETLFVWKALADAKSYDRLFTSIIEDSGIIERELFSKSSERELTNYLHIFEVLVEAAGRTRATLSELVHLLGSYIDGRRFPDGDEGNVQRIESDKSAVQIMTMHKAKGLEATVVFLFGGLEAVRDATHLHHEGSERCLYVGSSPPRSAQVEAKEEDQRLLYVSMTRAKARLYLPYFGWASSDSAERVVKDLTGAYGELNRTLDRDLGAYEHGSLFTKETVEEAPRREPVEAPEDLERAATWTPPDRLLLPPEARTMDRERERARGLTITSYSRIKALRGGYRGPEAGAAIIEAVGDDVHRVPPELATRAELPPGAESGRFLHELLEVVPLDVLRRGGLSMDPSSIALFERTLDRFGLSRTYLEHALDLVERSFLSPLSLGGRVLDGVASADRSIREMEFLYPLVGSRHRAFIKGFIDLVFEWEGRIFVADWKSDLLPGYSMKELSSHVDENYRLQAELYTLAMVKHFAIETKEAYDHGFGGTVYCFARAMNRTGDGTDGVYFFRPDYEDVLAFERSLGATDLEAGALP